MPIGRENQESGTHRSTCALTFSAVDGRRALGAGRDVAQINGRLAGWAARLIIVSTIQRPSVF
jgi:hypothetical protein